MDGTSMLSFPISDLLSQFGNFLTQLFKGLSQKFAANPKFQGPKSGIPTLARALEQPNS